MEDEAKMKGQGGTGDEAKVDGKGETGDEAKVDDTIRSTVSQKCTL